MSKHTCCPGEIVRCIVCIFLRYWPRDLKVAKISCFFLKIICIRHSHIARESNTPLFVEYSRVWKSPQNISLSSLLAARVCMFGRRIQQFRVGSGPFACYNIVVRRILRLHPESLGSCGMCDRRKSLSIIFFSSQWF